MLGFEQPDRLNAEHLLERTNVQLQACLPPDLAVSGLTTESTGTYVLAL